MWVNSIACTGPLRAPFDFCDELLVAETPTNLSVAWNAIYQDCKVESGRSQGNGKFTELDEAKGNNTINEDELLKFLAQNIV